MRRGLPLNVWCDEMPRTAADLFAKGSSVGAPHSAYYYSSMNSPIAPVSWSDRLQSWIGTLSLQRKASLITASVLMALAAVLVAVVQQIFQHSFGELEDKWIEDTARRVERVLSLEIDGLERGTRDYASWNATCDFMGGVARESYVASNLTEAVFANLRLNAFLPFDLTGRMQSGFATKPGKTVPEPAGEEWAAAFRPIVLALNQSVKTENKGLIKLPDGIALFACRPILHDDDTGPSRGVLVQVRRLDEALVTRLSEVTGVTLGLDAPGQDNMPRMVRDNVAGYNVLRVDARSLVLHTVLRDVEGREIGRLHIPLLRSIHEQGEQARWLLGGVLALVVVVAGGLIVWLLRALVISRLEILHTGVQQVKQTADLSLRMPEQGRDEIASLATDINGMLAALAQAEAQRIAAEQERENLSSQLLQAQKLEAIGTLAGGLAHDFNNLLASVVCSAGMLRLDLPASHPTLAHVNRIEKASSDAAAVIRQMLAYSRREASRFENVRLGEVVADVLRLLRSGLPNAIDLRFHNGAVDDLVYADAAQLKQVVMNLSTNASHAMAGAARRELDVIISEVTLPDKTRPETADLAPGHYLRLEVRDTGCGIPAENLARIFEPFYTTKPVGTGSGLGLSVVHGIITKHRGTVGVKSVPGVGTSFFLHLPRSEQRPEPVLANGAADAFSAMRILLVDDDPLVRETLVSGLERLGHVVSHASNAEAALRLLDQPGPPVGLLITDHVMPGMTGVELGEHVAARRPGLPMVLMSGFASTLDEVTIRAKGFSLLANKPVTLERLQEIIATVGASKSGGSARAVAKGVRAEIPPLR